MTSQSFNDEYTPNLWLYERCSPEMSKKLFEKFEQNHKGESIDTVLHNLLGSFNILYRQVGWAECSYGMACAFLADQYFNQDTIKFLDWMGVYHMCGQGEAPRIVGGGALRSMCLIEKNDKWILFWIERYD